MLTPLSEAKAECARWFAYLEDQDRRAEDLQKLAADLRADRCSRREGERRRAEIQGNGLTVYDEAKLADAVRVLLKHV